MFIFKNISIIIALTIISTACIASQNPKPSATNLSNYVSFKSPDGFKIDMPKSEPTIKTDTFDYSGIKGIGKSYNWKNDKDYDYYVMFYDLNNGKQSLTEDERKIYLEGNKKSVVDLLTTNNFPFTEKKYVFNGYEGVEIQADNTIGNAKMLVRFFYVNERFYYITLTNKRNTLEDSQIYQISDSFEIIDSDSKTYAK